MHKFINLMVCLIALLMPATLPAAVEVEHVIDTEIGARILDVTADPEEDLVFFLTPGTVLIYSTDRLSVMDRIPVDQAFDRIAYQTDDRLILTDGDSPRVTILRFNRIYDIDVSGRAVKGPAGAKVTLVVFDDYQ